MWWERGGRGLGGTHVVVPVVGRCRPKGPSFEVPLFLSVRVPLPPLPAAGTPPKDPSEETPDVGGFWSEKTKHKGPLRTAPEGSSSLRRAGAGPSLPTGVRPTHTPLPSTYVDSGRQGLRVHKGGDYTFCRSKSVDVCRCNQYPRRVSADLLILQRSLETKLTSNRFEVPSTCHTRDAPTPQK